MLGWLDPWVLRRPFERAAAHRYVREERPAFGGLDSRVLAALAPELAAARVLIDVGAGGGELARCARTAYPRLTIVTVEPSHGFTPTLRACAEALPLADGVADVAVCLSSLRHARDRGAALRELRRVVRPGGVVFVVELDRDAGAARVRRHTGGMPSYWSRAAFRAVVLPACPGAPTFTALARDAGFHTAPVTADPEQPFFLLRLT